MPSRPSERVQCADTMAHVTRTGTILGPSATIMRIWRFITQAVLIIFLAFMSPFQASAVESQPPIPPPARDVSPQGDGLSQLNWIEDIISALDYFITNYPPADFVPYLEKLTLVRDALSRHDRRTVTSEIGAFFTLLADRSGGISGAAADELANFARLVMPQEYVIFVPARGDGRVGEDSESLSWNNRGAPLSVYP